MAGLTSTLRSIMSNLDAAKKNAGRDRSLSEIGGNALGTLEGTVGQAYGQKGAFGAAGGALNSAGDALMAFNPLLGVIAKLTGAFLELGDGLRSWGNDLHNANMQLAAFSGAMSTVQAEHEVRQTMLEMSQGDARAGSAGRMSESLDQLNRSMAPMENAWANFKNDFAERHFRGMDVIVRYINSLFNVKDNPDEWAETLDKNRKGQVSATDLDKMLEEVKARRPKRLGGGM